MTNLAEGDVPVKASRSTDIVADSAVAILSKPASEVNGECGGDDPMWDIFMDKS